MRYLRDDKGLSLTELLVVCVLMVVVLATMFLLMGATQNMTNMASARAIAADEGQTATDLMARDLRQAQQNDDLKTLGAPVDRGAFTIAEPTHMQFWSDVNNDQKPELVTYEVVGESLYRWVTPPTNTVAQFTYGTPTLAQRKRIVEHIDTTGGLFCYHEVTVDDVVVCASGEKHGFKVVSTATPLTTAQKICLVGIHLENSASSSNKTVDVTTSVLVKVRVISSLMDER
jgi:Tfp pilus assembly protein PilW